MWLNGKKVVEQGEFEGEEKAKLLNELDHLKSELRNEKKQKMEEEKGNVQHEDQVQHKEDKGNECSVCMENQPDVVFLPCGHVACCSQCSDGVKACPICRKDIENKQKLFFA